MKPIVIHIVGKRNSGKTRLILKLIPLLKKLNLRIGTLKSDGGGHFDWDTKGKDTHDFYDAGSEISGILSDNQFAIKTEKKHELDFDEFIFLSYKNVDLVLVEGFGSLKGNKIETLRKGISNKLITSKSEFIATFGDRIFIDSTNHFNDSDINELALFIKKTFLDETVNPLVSFETIKDFSDSLEA